jgi:glutaconate CoA-transferase subunit B
MADKYAKIGEYTPVEAMVINAARFLKNFDGQRGLIGTGLPLVATQLAKMLYSPNMIIFVETGQADAKPEELPISIMDSRLTYGSSWQMGDPEGLFPLSRGEIDFGFIGGAQIDKYGNVNSTFIGGDYNKPAKRLAGTAGAVDIGVFAKTTVTLMAHQKRRVVEKVDYLTTPGWMVKKWPGGELVRREELGMQEAASKQKKTAMVNYTGQNYTHHLPLDLEYELDMEQGGVQLYSIIRECEAEGIDQLVFAPLPSPIGGIAATIIDRIVRAASSQD